MLGLGSHFPAQRLFALFLVPLIIAALALAAACGGGGDDDGGASPTAPATQSGDDEDTGDDDDGGDGMIDETQEVGLTFWHSGFEVTVDTINLRTVESGVFQTEINYIATIEVTAANQGEDTWTFDPEMALTSAGNTYTEQSFQSEPPSVPGGLSSEGTFIFVVDDEFSLDDATLLVGYGGKSRAVVPLGPSGDELVSLEPATIDVTGEIAMQRITLSFAGGETRADFPESHSQQDEGKLALTLDFAATSRTSGNWNIFETNFVLTKPDGNSVTPDSSKLGSLAGNDAGVTTEGLSLTFDVDDPASGEYTLIFTPGSWFVGDDGVAESTFTFEVP